MTTTHRLEIPPVFWFDHADRCVQRTVPVGKGRSGRIAVELSGDEVADLHSDAVHYSHAGDFDFVGALGLASSARATRKAIETQVADLDEVIEAWHARLKAERAWRDSPQGIAALAVKEAERQAALDAVGARLAAEAHADPRVRDLPGRRVRHEQTGGEWVEVDGYGFGTSGHTLYAAGYRKAIVVEHHEWDVRCSHVGIEVEV